MTTFKFSFPDYPREIHIKFTNNTFLHLNHWTVYFHNILLTHLCVLTAVLATPQKTLFQSKILLPLYKN